MKIKTWTFVALLPTGLAMSMLFDLLAGEVLRIGKELRS